MFLKIVVGLVATLVLLTQHAEGFNLPFQSKSSSSQSNYEKDANSGYHHRSMSVTGPLFGWNRDYYPMTDALSTMMTVMDTLDPFVSPFSGAVAAPSCSPSGYRVTGLCVEMAELDDKYEYTVDMPGFNKDHLKLQVVDGDLFMEAERVLKPKRASSKPEPSEASVGAEEEAGKVETKMQTDNTPKQTIKRKFVLPEDAEVTGIEAELQDGVLSVTVPKKKPTEPTVINIHLK
ncbi:Hsp20/alpha crystallin family protein [archaeon]|nr:MAG: Hsp20/alpha crystallin family protein [archaeon]